MASIALLLSPIALAGGPGDVLEVKLSPLTYSKHGKITACGLHFSVAFLSEERMFAVQGSGNAMFEDRIATLFKVLVMEARDGQLIRHRVQSAYAITKSISTTDFPFNMPGDDDHSILYMDGENIESTMLPVYLLNGGVIGFNIDGGNDYTFNLKPSDNLELRNNIFECIERGTSQALN